MEEAKYIREADKSYMSFAIAKDRLLPQYHIKMISENYMEYIIQADTLDVNSELILNYNITSMRALSASIGKNMITSELIKNLIYDLKNMSKEITRYMLDINNICLDTDKIMIDNIRGHFSFIYYPCENKTFIQSMQDLIDDLIQYVDYTDRISVESIYALYGVLRQPNCSFEDMLEVFNNAGINNSNNMVNNNINAMNNANSYGGNNQGNNTEYCFNNAGANMNSNNIDNNRTGYNDNNSNNSNIYNNTNNSYNNNSCNNTSYNNSTYNNLNTQYNNTYNNNTSYSNDNNNYNANIYSNDDIYNAINEENNNIHNKKSLKDRFLKNKSKKESNNKAQTDMQSQYGTAQPQQNNINAVTDMQNLDAAASTTIPPTFIISVIALISSVIAAIVIKAYMPRKICLVAAIISAALMVLIYRKNEDAIKNYKFANRSKNKADKNKEKNNDNNNSYNDMYNNNDWYNNLNNGIDNNTFANNCNNSEYISAYNPSDMNNQTFNNNYTNAGMPQNNNYTNAGMSQNNNIDNQNMSNNYAYDNMSSYEQTTVLREEGTTVLNDCISHVFKESYLEYIDDNERQIYGGNITIRQDNMLIGSSNICDYVIDNPAISRNHARISRIGDKYYMTDLDSTNGTFINGIRMNKSETKELNSGEEVMIGRIRFRFVCN
ncbi:FHA domain-containing protein [Falcatimonas sp. MSJ-15]|uniref:DUF6382 domain-containing protein n=1 Tax=Falcatimonas sp. MSJ-15 TaxID=2841515 RepID=UPI001C11F1ED|nr:DUF6382 domain-containing protein [Falcatimonas sp. MSJ-15]MBU5470921.1 FHA domain-containing protein [Falcatimonas sp. MSJ-15]